MYPLRTLRRLLLLLIACTTAFAEKTDDEKKDAEEEQKKEEAAEKKRKEGKVIKKEFAYSFNDIRDHLVLIEHENGTGSGFVAKMGDHHYIFTNQHVLLGAGKINFKSVTGKQFRPKKVELSATRDIARLLLDSDEGLGVSSNIGMDAPICIFGNSDGAGVATELYGRINGIGGELVEVSADFVSGNSGSPVLNLDQEVIGIASYVRFSGNSRSKEGTQFENKTRRFCYRITDSRWVPVNWGKYNKKYGTLYFKNEQLVGCMENIYAGWKDDLTNRVDLDNGSDRRISAWSQTHNNILIKYRGQGKFRSEYAKSLSKLGSLCKNESTRIELFLAAEDKYLTDFLRDGFKRQAATLGAYEELSIYVSDLMH